MINNNEELPNDLSDIFSKDIYLQIVKMNNNGKLEESVIMELDDAFYLQKEDRNNKLKEIVSSQDIKKKETDEKEEIKYL